MASQGKKMVIFLGNKNSGDQNFLNPFIYHRDTSYYMVLKLIGVNPSGPFAPILSDMPVNIVRGNNQILCDLKKNSGRYAF